MCQWWRIYQPRRLLVTTLSSIQAVLTHSFQFGCFIFASTFVPICFSLLEARLRHFIWSVFAVVFDRSFLCLVVEVKKNMKDTDYHGPDCNNFGKRASRVLTHLDWSLMVTSGMVLHYRIYPIVFVSKIPRHFNVYWRCNWRWSKPKQQITKVQERENP